MSGDPNSMIDDIVEQAIASPALLRIEPSEIVRVNFKLRGDFYVFR